MLGRNRRAVYIVESCSKSILVIGHGVRYNVFWYFSDLPSWYFLLISLSPFFSTGWKRVLFIFLRVRQNDLLRARVLSRGSLTATPLWSAFYGSNSSLFQYNLNICFHSDFFDVLQPQHHSHQSVHFEICNMSTSAFTIRRRYVFFNVFIYAIWQMYVHFSQMKKRYL